MAKVIIEGVRFSYVQVFEPKAAQEGAQPKYSVSLIIPKSNKAEVDKIKKAIDQAIEEGKSKWGNKIPKNLKTPLRDGDEEREGRAEYENCFFINASSFNRPGVVDSALNPIIDKDEFYSGCYGRASVNFYAFDRNGNRGTAAGLNNLQKQKDGENLSGGASAAEDFGAEEDDDI